MRRGELLALQKSDIDLPAGLITVTRSHGRNTTKGEHAEVIPIANELAPYVRGAIKVSPSELVFPKPNGKRMRPDVALEGVLRSALARAGIVLGYEHVCRAKDCGHAEPVADATLRTCPKHGYKLWPKARVRPIRFHDLRHTTGSLLMMAGANPAAVQRILRHKDPRITTEVYGHLEPGYLRSEINRLRFEPDAAAARTDDVVAKKSAPLVTRLLPEPEKDDLGASLLTDITVQIPASVFARHRRFELLTYGSGGIINPQWTTSTLQKSNLDPFRDQFGIKLLTLSRWPARFAVRLPVGLAYKPF
jgi:hypothetical protein